MSYFDDASLVMIPSGYKTSKVYSVKPTDGTGDLTFSRSNDTATRVNSAGLIEKVRTNLVPNGLSFNASTGVLYTTVTSDSPISGVSSTRITKNEAAGTLRYGNQNASASALTGSISYTISRYFKYDGYNVTTSLEYNDSFQWGGTSWVQNINIASTGVTLQAPSNCTSKITNVGNGWYRVDVTIVNGASPSGSPVSYLIKVDSTLSTGQGFLTAAPQLETGDIATDYIATTSAAVSVGPVANVPRLDYLNSSCPRLLLEPQRTNLLQYSEQLDNAYWSKDAGASVTANAATSPDGYANADRLSFTSSGLAVYKAGLGLSGAHRFSVYLKGEGANIGKQIYLEIAGGTSINVTLTGSWQRFTAIADNASSVAIKRLNSGQADSVLAWGAQLEAGAYATSYIPTLGAAVTRGTDECSKTGISSLIGQTEGTLFVDMEFEGYDNQPKWVAFLGTGADYIGIYTTSDSKFLIEVATSGAAQFLNQSYLFSVGQRYKLAVAYKANDFALYINGTQVATDNSGTPPATNKFGLEYNTTAGNLTARTYNQALLFKTRLSNADLAALTA